MKTCVYVYGFRVPSITGEHSFFRGQLKITGCDESTDFQKLLNQSAISDWERHRTEVITAGHVLFDFVSLVFISDSK
jgi:hypothetical protein